MEGPGERLCVGEPERLSLDDWWKPEEKLRLLCMGGGGVCLVSFFKMLLRRLSCPSFLLLFLLRRAILAL